MAGLLLSTVEVCFLIELRVIGSFSWLRVTAATELMVSFGSEMVSRGKPLPEAAAVMVDCCSPSSSLSVFPPPKVLLSVSTELPSLREGGVSDWSSSVRGDWGVGLVVGRGGVSGRKCKGLEFNGTGVDPSSETESNIIMHTNIIGRVWWQCTKLDCFYNVSIPIGKDRVLVGVGVASLLLLPSEGVAPGSLMLIAQAGSYCRIDD